MTFKGSLSHKNRINQNFFLISFTPIVFSLFHFSSFFSNSLIVFLILLSFFLHFLCSLSLSSFCFLSFVFSCPPFSLSPSDLLSNTLFNFASPLSLSSFSSLPPLFSLSLHSFHFCYTFLLSQYLSIFCPQKCPHSFSTLSPLPRM